MNYLTRKLICERLRLGLRQSYNIVSPSYGPLINSDEILHIINISRRGIQQPLAYLPSDIVTAEDLERELEGVVSASRILTWTRRTKNVPPHFRINKHTTRFSRERFFNWLNTKSSLRRKTA